MRVCPLLAAGILLSACGAKTGLLFEVSEDEADAGVDAAVVPGEDAGPPACELAPVEPPVQADDPLSSIWIANSGEGTVSKLDTRTGDELGRYRTGDTTSTDPSRTSVDLRGAVYVGNRAFDWSVQPGVTKIAGRLDDCVDRNANGIIETSHGTVALPWGEDECVLWSTDVGELGCLLRAVAVDVSEDAFGRLRTVVYAGCWTTQRIYQLDAETGAILQDFPSGGVYPYGFAVTAQGTMFVASGVVFDGTPQRVGVVDLAQTPPRVDEAELPACNDDLFGARISYGIAADRKGRLWTCDLSGCLNRFDPATRLWAQAQTTACRGIAIGPDGTVWTGMGSMVQQWNAETLELLRQVPTSGLDGIGVAIDFDGKVWFVNQGSQDVSRIDPDTGVEEARFPVGFGPYTYSDMTGIQLRTNLGVYWQFEHVFEPCDPEAPAGWRELALDVSLPLGSGVGVRMRGADDRALLEGALFVDAPGVWSEEEAASAVPAELAGLRYLGVQLTAQRGADGRWPALRTVRVRTQSP